MSTTVPTITVRGQRFTVDEARKLGEELLLAAHDASYWGPDLTRETLRFVGELLKRDEDARYVLDWLDSLPVKAV